MKTYKNFYEMLCSVGNLTLAWRKAREKKANRPDVAEFDREVERNLLRLHHELKNQTYNPRPLQTFILRDPKTRKIAKSDFRDRVVHHALINIIGPLFQKSFICDSYANQKRKGPLRAIKRFNEFSRKVTNNFTSGAFCFKADIKKYFQNVNHAKLVGIINKKIKDEKVMWLVWQILSNHDKPCGMPLGNYTSQFFANVYLNELDYFVKNELKLKCYIRYVDDFISLHENKEQLSKWKEEINNFLVKELKLELHPDKSGIKPLKNGITFLGYRIYGKHKRLRKNNFKRFQSEFNNKIAVGKLSSEELLENLTGWFGYAKHANTYKLRKEIIINLNSTPKYL